MDVSKDDMNRRHSLPYPMELGAPAFAPVPVQEAKDVILNQGRLHAQQEYERIMEQVEVLQRQAAALTNRMAVSEMMHKCVYGFKPVHGKIYYVYFDSHKQHHWMCHNHPDGWCAGPGEHNSFVMAVRMMGDSTWEEVKLSTD